MPKKTFYKTSLLVAFLLVVALKITGQQRVFFVE